MPTPTATQIRAEIDADPKSLGYAALKVLSNGPQAVAARMNELNTVPADTLFRPYVSLEDMLAEIVFSEYSAWTAAQKTNIEQLLRGARVKTGSANMRMTLGAVIPVGSSRTAMVALASRQAARAEILWGDGIVVTDTQVADALAL